MEDAQSAVLQQFCDITGVDDVGAAISVLEATNWQLEEAINLQFATGAPAAAGLAAGQREQPAPGGALPDLSSLEEDEVRAPLPVVRDRLIGDAGPHGIMPGRAARYGAPAAADRGPTHIDVFQDFEGPDGAGAAPAAAAAARGAGAGSQRLSDLFKPPAGLLFEGDFEAAKGQAAKQGCWLLVNVQTADEFDTHRLNRDTWSQGLVQDMLRESFVFWQVYNTAPQGGALVGSYHLSGLPAVFIVDPITGAKLWERTGFISADALVEELVPFMDAGPNDPGASALANRFMSQAAKRRNRGSGMGAAAAAAAGAGGGAEPMTEDDQLALALAMSVEGDRAGASGQAAAAAAGGHGDDDELDEEAIWREIQKKQREEDEAAAAAAAAPAAAAPQAGSSGNDAAGRQPLPAPAAAAAAAGAAAAAAAAAPAVDVEAVQAAAAGRLAPEPPAGAEGSCRVAFRLPDGSRAQRWFKTSDTVAALQDYVVSVSKDAAAMPSFVLSEPRPGSAPLTDPAATIEQAGAAGAMLVLRSR